LGSFLDKIQLKKQIEKGNYVTEWLVDKEAEKTEVVQQEGLAQEEQLSVVRMCLQKMISARN
jgi:ketol-acid reductoisomerase